MVINSDIQTKADIISGLQDVFDRTIAYCQAQDDTIFDKPLAEGKWSAAQNIEHLCTSTFPMAKGMSMPKLMMKATFGTNNRSEKTIVELYAKYQSALAGGQKAPAKFDPESIGNEKKVEMLEKFAYARDKVITVLDKWDDKSLSKYILPHPALGKLTIREMLFFTIFHTEHHLNTIKRITV